jgi:uracil-DNA glycosylase family 4
VDGTKRNRYLDAMGVDVWVRRPGVALAGIWVDPPAATASEVVAGEAVGLAPEATPGVPAEVAPSGAIEPVAGAQISTRAPDMPVAAALDAPAVVRAPAPPLSGDETARWQALRSEVLSCTKCALHKSRTQGVLGVGPHRTEWMVIGEAPGAEEDRRGEPFVGRAGHLLDAMLQAIGLNRGSNVYIANVLKSRPPNNRDPKPEEVAACLPYLMRQIELLRPRLLLAVGRIAAQNLLATDLSLSRLRSKVHHFGELNTPLIVTYHPAYLLRTPSDKRKAWEDLKFARTVFRQLADRANTDGHLS